MSKNSQNRRLRKKKKRDLRSKEKERALRSRYNKIGNIFFDESGNTGTNLLDESQPFFVLGSCDYTTPEGQSLIKLLLLPTNQSSEVKFVNLKRRTSGQDAILTLLNHRLITPRRVKYVVFHKKFVVVTKIVDDLIENYTFRQGLDLYQGAQNVALSNLLYGVIPSFCGQNEFDMLLKCFTEMMKKRDTTSIDNFYAQVENLNKICEAKGHNLSEELFLIAETKKIINDIFEGLPQHSNNPAIPALFSLSYYWGTLYKKGFKVNHDNAKPVEQQKEMYEHFSTMNQKKVKFGYGIREFELPLKIRQINFLDSKDHVNIQLADIITSSYTYWLKHKVEQNTEDEFFKKLDEINFSPFIKNIVWPSSDVTPEALGADPNEKKENPANVVAKFLHKAQLSHEK